MKRLEIRLTREQYALVYADAVANGLPVGTWVRLAVMARLDAMKPKPKARRAASKKTLPDSDERPVMRLSAESARLLDDWGE